MLFMNVQHNIEPVHSPTYFISPHFTPCPIHSSSWLAPSATLPHHPPPVQSLHCQFVALASPSVIDHGGNSVVFAGLEMCVSAGRERRSNTLITAGL